MSKKWLRDTDKAEEAVDEMLERIIERDGIGAYEAASGDFLTGYCNTIAFMDGSPERLLGMLRRLEAMYVRLGQEKQGQTDEQRPQRTSKFRSGKTHGAPARNSIAQRHGGRDSRAQTFQGC